MVHATGRVTLRRTAAIAAVVFTLGLLAGACGTSESDSAEGGGEGPATGQTPSISEPDAGPPQDGGKLAYALVAETSGWNPSTGQWAASGHQVAVSIFDRLGAWDTEYNVKPFLASSIEPNGDFTQWTLGVREGVTFHNGDPVDAEAIAVNLRTFQTAQLTRSALAPIESVEASEDGKSVVVTMNRPFSTYPLQLTSQVGVIAWPGMYDTVANPNATLNPVGSGPFEFENWEQGAKLNVVKNDNYWREGLPHLDEIEYSIITDNQARQASIKTGTVDMAEFFDPESIAELTATTTEDEYRIFSDTEGETEEALIMLNTSKAPLDTEDARRAIALATNTDEVVQLISNGEVQAANGPFSEGSPWFAPDSGNPGHNLDEAKALVEKVKADGDGTFSFTLTGVPVLETQRVAQLLQQQWAAAGIEVRLEDIEQATLIGKAVSGDYQALTWRQFGATLPDGEYVWTTCENIKPAGEISLNFARNCNEKLDAAMSEARATLDPELQKQKYKIFQEELAKDIPYIWLYQIQGIVIASTKVKDITKATLPSGDPELAMVGVVHPVAQIWIAP